MTLSFYGQKFDTQTFDEFLLYIDTLSLSAAHSGSATADSNLQNIWFEQTNYFRRIRWQFIFNWSLWLSFKGVSVSNLSFEVLLFQIWKSRQTESLRACLVCLAAWAPRINRKWNSGIKIGITDQENIDVIKSDVKDKFNKRSQE